MDTADREVTVVEKMRKLPWSVGFSIMNSVYVQYFFFGSIFILFLNELGLDKAQIGGLLSLMPFFGLIALFVAPALWTALEWVRANDERVINLILALRAEEIVAETTAHRNACGGGAVAGTVAAARTMGAEKGYLLEYTTSHHVMPRGPATDFVGYAAVAF